MGVKIPSYGKIYVFCDVGSEWRDYGFVASGSDPGSTRNEFTKKLCCEFSSLIIDNLVFRFILHKAIKNFHDVGLMFVN